MPARRSRGPARLIGVRLVLSILAASSGAVSAQPRPAWADWPVQTGGSGALARAGTAPLPPSGVTAMCGTGLLADTIAVSWSAVTRATSYSIYQSTTSATSGYAPAATGLTATSWTSPGLGTATYWYEVTAVTGTYWQSLDSSATAPISISVSLLCL